MNITNEELLKLKEAILMVNDMFNDVCGEWSVDEMRKLNEALEIIESKTSKSDAEAKQIAAATYNKERKPGQKPITRKSK